TPPAPPPPSSASTEAPKVKPRPTLAKAAAELGCVGAIETPPPGFGGYANCIQNGGVAVQSSSTTWTDTNGRQFTKADGFQACQLGTKTYFKNGSVCPTQ